MKHATFIEYAGTNTPRYTSYPTAVQFHDGIDAGVFADWLAALDPAGKGSLYIHIPYCREMCWYCGCSTRATTRREPVAAYLEKLIGEIAITAAYIPHRPRIGHVHLGGGTPTILDPDQFGRLMACLDQHFDIGPDAEKAIEIDPRTFSPELARQLARSGINRASIGVQTFDRGVQSRINRIQSFETVRDCVSDLREAGISSISMDLLYGLPGQTIESCVGTVALARSLSPGRLSVFGYAHVPHMRRHQNLIRTADLPDATARVAQALEIADALEQAGYVPVGIDHYARSEDPLAILARSGGVRRNFQGYTTDRSDYLIGFGASAISHLPQGYAQNTLDVRAWSEAVSAGRNAICRGFALSDDDRMRGAIIEQLMSGLEADVPGVASAYGLAPPQPDLSDLEQDGLVDMRASGIRIPEQNRMLARIVASRFDAYWQSDRAGRHSNSV
ncbi:oxygen-independent coproporphyrinogen III oxidase [Hyphobacterium sp. HN65]|uniref:Coproporphyrinogen-III oxidase n=1 Tax=Hyphobacterium lacteum TaxID=3116575 RepID=A0ABU7LP61_9PROT|nr:oxygen-independent coproporphyrinogen III oxidase [Hyphobacterium sp. HN65]MEE2525690.1 oxygen-independent coproporphyrinogen III oxidase [Hyphobacterium sp. HN65]